MTMRIENERERIEESDELTDADRELIKEFDRKLSVRLDTPEGPTHARHLNIVRLAAQHVSGLDRLFVDEKDVARVGTSNAQDRAGEAAEEYVAALNAHGYADNSMDVFVSSLAKLINTFAAIERIPDWEELLKPTYADEDPAPEPSSILYWEEHVVPMIEAANSWRDRALIAVEWSSGMRPESELHKLNVGHVTDAGDHFVISVPPNAKTGARDIRLTLAAPYLRKWLEVHPARDVGEYDDSTPLWVCAETQTYQCDPTDRLKYGGLRKRFYALGERVGIERPTNARHFRRSRASVLAKKPGISQADLETYFGWVRGSDSAAHYIARYSDTTGAKIAAAEGREDEEEAEPDPITPVKCPECDRWTPRFREDCLWCPASFDPENLAAAEDAAAVEEAVTRGEEFQEVRDDIVRMVTNGELSEEDIETARDLEAAIRAYPDLLEQAETLRSLIDADD
jgi:hypothetical protein